ncbi:MAG: nucleotide exchange factor GrpE [bacterium]
MSDEQSTSHGSKTQGEGKSMHHNADSKTHIDKKQGEQDIPEGNKDISDDLAIEKERNKELYDKYLRLQAEFENFKKRMEREKCEYFKYALERLIKDLIPVFDHLELAIQSAKESKNFESFSEGIQLIYKQLKDILAKEGLSYECSVGEKFDPCKHEAMMHMESADHEPNVVMEEHKKGYFLNDRLIRPAMVTVAKRPEEKKKGEDN